MTFTSFKAFPIKTNRYIFKNNYLAKCGYTQNTGIECYALELICSNEFHRIIDKCSLKEWADVLVKDILNKGVLYKNSLLWRWEKKPKKTDYKYPFDWDDTFKAIDAIYSYKRHYKIDSNYQLPNIHIIKELIMKTVYKNQYAGEDEIIKCNYYESLYMFITDMDGKKNNTEDVVVTAVLIRSIVKNYHRLDQEMSLVIDGLLNKVIEIVEMGIYRRIPLMKISRCYLSWGLLIIILIDISKYIPRIQRNIERISKEYIEKCLYKDLLPKEIYNNLIVDETNYARIIEVSMGLQKGFVDTVGIRRNNNMKLSQVMFRHRRLNHFYGSPIWSKLVDLYANADLALEKK